jgi:predicted lipid-binding transport protein (Tim44 family)
MDGFQFIDILILAVIAGVLFFRLRGVLGRRTGYDKSSEPGGFNGEAGGRKSKPDYSKDEDSVIHLPGNEKAEAARAESRATAGEGVAKAAEAGLTQIALADSSFDKAGFLEGASKAFEMVITAFAAGDVKTLRPLLARDVYEDFAGAIKAREEEKKTLETTFVGMRSAEITDAELRERTAYVTVTFTSEQINILKDEEGRILEGDPNGVATITDVWTFARNTKSRDPNWTLIATDGGN